MHWSSSWNMQKMRGWNFPYTSTTTKEPRFSGDFSIHLFIIEVFRKFMGFNVESFERNLFLLKKIVLIFQPKSISIMLTTEYCTKHLPSTFSLFALQPTVNIHNLGKFLKRNSGHTVVSPVHSPKVKNYRF